MHPAPLRRVALGALAALAYRPAQAAAGPSLHIVLPPFPTADRAQSHYFVELLQLAMARTAREGPWRVEQYGQGMSAERAIEEVRRGGVVNLTWTAISARREQVLRPVRVSLLRALNDYRVLLIRRGEQARFAAVDSLDTLRRFTGGSGSQWAVTETMQQRGLPLVTTLRNGSLLRMLSAGRFDYVALGLYEAWDELALHAGSALEIERRLLLHVPTPIYFFVGRNDVALAQRIERGLRQAQADGSFDALMGRYFRRGLEELRKGKRTVLMLA